MSVGDENMNRPAGQNTATLRAKWEKYVFVLGSCKMECLTSDRQIICFYAAWSGWQRSWIGGISVAGRDGKCTLKWWFSTLWLPVWGWGVGVAANLSWLAGDGSGNWRGWGGIRGTRGRGTRQKTWIFIADPLEMKIGDNCCEVRDVVGWCIEALLGKMSLHLSLYCNTENYSWIMDPNLIGEKYKSLVSFWWRQV